ncbi:MAG: phytoene/squalene synthase family protein [Candidatus Sulfotelmatobacter sp.]
MSAGTQSAAVPWTPVPQQLVMAYSVCRGITRTAAKNFYYAFLVLSRRKREALCAVYAFMRRCDDIADDATMGLPERRQKLDLWLDALHRAQQGQPTDDAILLALTDTQRRYAIPAGLLDELALGTAMDVADAADAWDAAAAAPPSTPGLTVQYKTFEDLCVYCHRVASVVGLVCIHVFGYRDPEAEPLAERCGLAFQLTNILRDVKEDANMGRVYLPQDDLEKFGVSASELLTAPDPARFRPLFAFEAARARELYAAGDALIPYVSEDSQPALWVLVNIYRRLLDKIAEKQFDVFTAKVALSRWEKLRILGKGFFMRLM